MERRLSTVLCADVAGYSRLMGVDEEGTLNTLKKSRQIVDRVVVSQRGRVFGGAGDSVMAEFQNPVLAVAAALEIQEETIRLNADRPVDQRMLFRIGINLGDLIVDGENLFGDGVNVAARLEALAEPGGIAMSQAVREQVMGKLPIAPTDFGERRLKNIARPVRVYRVAPTLAIGQPAVEGREELAVPTKPSIAVLPFVNMTGDPEQGFFSDGISEDIITSLSKFRELFVISRHSSFAYRDKEADAPSVGRALGVRYVLQGSVRAAGSRARISAQLVDASTGRHLWAERYDRDLTDVFAVQDEVTELIVATIAQRLAATERGRTRSAGTGDIEAYGLLMRGQRLLFAGGREANREARRMYEKAIERDPEFARAYAGLSMTHILDWRYDWTEHPEQALKAALDLAKKAVTMDAGNARAHAALGFAYLYNKQTTLAISCYERAFALNPNDADIMAEYADALTYDRRPTEAVKLIERAMRLNPYFPDWYLWYLGDAYYTLGRYEDAIATLQRMQDPTEGRRILTASYAQLGRLEEARAQAAEVLKAQPDFTIREWAKKQPEQDGSGLDHYLGALRLAGLPE